MKHSLVTEIPFSHKDIYLNFSAYLGREGKGESQGCMFIQKHFNAPNPLLEQLH